MCNKKCVLSNKETLKDLMKFNLSCSNLPYKKCQKFPKIIKKFIKTVSIQKLIAVSETIPYSIDSDHAYAINTAYQPYKIFKYKGNNYYIRFTLINNDGSVEYDSSKGTTDVDAKIMQLHTTRMEFQDASEKKWGTQLRESVSVNKFEEYAAIWIPDLILRDYLESGVNVKTTWGFRFSVEINPETGEYVPLL